MNRSTLWPMALFVLLTSGCGEAPSASASDTGNTASDDTGTSQPGDTATTGDTATDGTTATLTGTIDRSADPSSGGIGDVYVVVMDDNPMTGGGNALGAVILEDVDFTDSSASFTYTITGIAPSSAEVFVTAFLDDNGNADAVEPGPDMGDLVSMEGVSFPTITIDQAQTYDLDLTLSFSMPF